MKRITIGLSAAALAIGVGVPLGTFLAPSVGTSQAPDALGLDKSEKAKPTDTRRLPDGSTVTRYERTYEGLPVVGGRYAVKFGANAAETGQVLAKQPVHLSSTKATLTPAEAQAKVPTRTYLKGAPLRSQTASLIVFLDHDGTSRLAYDVFITGDAAGVTPVRTHVYVDATTGKTIATDSEVYFGKGDGVYAKNVSFGTVKEGQGYTFRDSHGNATFDLRRQPDGAPTSPVYDADDRWGDNGGVQSQAVDAQAGLEKTYEFWEKTFGRRGVWDNGKGAKAVVRWKNCEANAMWSGDTMYLGEGRSCQHPLGQLDVIAHEMTHGVTAATAKLVYSRESGGLNEAMSDIFATMTEFYANQQGDTPDYLMGELIDLHGNGKPLRYMDQPSKDGVSFDCWESSFTSPSSEVHYTSGPMNHAFYLLAEGSGAKTVNGVKYNSPTCNGSTVSGIGRDKAARIVYDALNSPTIPRTATYAQFRGEMIKAARARYGAGSQECKSADAAMAGVNTPATSESCGTAPSTSTTSTSPSSSSTTSTSSTTSSPTTTVTTSTPPAGTTPLVNGQPMTVAAQRGTTSLYTIEVPEGAKNLSISTQGGKGDVDLYVRLGEAPTRQEYDCRPYQTGSKESCGAGRPAPGVYYVMLDAYEAYSDVTLSATFEAPDTSTSEPTQPTTSEPTVTSTSEPSAPTPPAPTSSATTTAPSTTGTVELANGVPVTISGAKGSVSTGTFTVPAGARLVSVSTQGGTGDVDLFVQRGSAPSETSYECRPFQVGNREECSTASPASGTYHVRLQGYEAYSGVTLVVRWS